MRQSTRKHPSYQRLRNVIEAAREYQHRDWQPARQCRLDSIADMIEATRHPSLARFLTPDPDQRTWVPREKRWTVEEREDRRAAHDAEFRRRLIRRLRGQAKRLGEPYYPRSLDEAASAIKRQRGDALKAIADRLDRLGITIDPGKPTIIGRALLPVERSDAPGLLPSYPFKVVPSAAPSRILADDAPHYIWREGGGVVDDRYLPAVARDGRAEYVCADRRAQIQAVAWLPPEQDRTVHARVHGTDYTVTLPEGYRWVISNGHLELVTPSGRTYRPSARDITRKGAAKLLTEGRP